MPSVRSRPFRKQSKTLSSSSSTTTTSSSSRPKMKIKPFRQPPLPPANLYQSTIATLLSATRSILRHEPALKPPPLNNNNNNNNGVVVVSTPHGVSSPKSTALMNQGDDLFALEKISREELYRSVEDLCVHGHAARLYDDVIRLLEEGAVECLGRLMRLREEGSGVNPVEVGGDDGGSSSSSGSNGENNAGLKEIGFERLPDVDASLVVLSWVKKVYGDFVDYLNFVRSIFLYLDRSFVLLQGIPGNSNAGSSSSSQNAANGNANPNSNNNKLSLWDAGINFFKRHMVAASMFPEKYSVADVCVASILHQIKRERDGEAVDRLLLRSNIRIMCELPGLYNSLFLPQFLDQSVDYFLGEGRHWMEHNPNALVSFCQQIEKRLNQAHDMGVYYLPSSKEPLLVSVVEKNLLSPHVDSFLLLPRNLYPLLSIQNSSDKTTSQLHLLCMHLRRIHKLDALKNAFLTHAKQTGKEIIDNTPNNKDIIPLLLKYKLHLEMLTKNAFSNQELFLNSLKGILEDVLNESEKTGRLIAELLAKHVDQQLKSAKTLSDEGEEFLNDALSLFRHLSSKDVFEAFYKRDLAKRLLLGKSASIDFEKSFLSKLKTECGTGYTAKMEGMFKDMDLSRDVMTSFTAANNNPNPNPNSNGKMDVQILTTGYWPVYPQFKNIKLPPDMTEYVKKFQNYYGNKYQGRRIAWQHSLGNCIVKANFVKGSKDLVLSQYQTLALVLCFNDTTRESWTIGDVMKTTGIDDRGEAERTLLSLSMGKGGTRVLVKHSKHKNKKLVSDDDTFSYNANFESRQHRIKITSIQMKETAKEREKTHESVSRDRLYLIDAAVVRIMKARKTIDHQTLLGEVMNQVKFPCSGGDVKKRIESLIEREYMERDENSVSRYNYLA